MHGRTIALLAGLLVLAAAPAASAQVPGLPPIFPPSQEEPEEPKPRPEEPQEQPPEEPKPKPRPEGPPPPPPPPQPQPGPQPQEGPPPPAPTILLKRSDVFLGGAVEITGRARPGAELMLMSREPWNLGEREQVSTAIANASGIYKVRYRPYGNAQLTVVDQTVSSKPVDVFVTPRMELDWFQRRGRVDALVYSVGTSLIGARGAKVHFYGFTSRRARTGRRLGGDELVVAETKDGKTLVGTYLRIRSKRKLQGLGYCVEWGGRFDRPEWTRACGKRTMRF